MQIISGKQFKPFAVLLGGVAGVGKSTWSANAPKPLFVCGDEVSELGVDRLPQFKTWDELKSQLKWVIDNDKGHETIVVDTLDYAEKCLHRHILASDEKSKGVMGAALGGFGKAYEKAANEMNDLLENYIKPLRDIHGKNVILIVHSKKSQVTDVLQTMTYETHDMCLHQKVQSVWSDWVSGIFFADFITYKVDGDNTDKTFLTGEGERVLYTTKKPGHFGKNRWSLPESLPLEFNEFYSRFKAFYAELPKASSVVDDIISLLANVKDEELKKKIVSQVELSKNDPKKLDRILTRTRELVGG